MPEPVPISLLILLAIPLLLSRPYLEAARPLDLLSLAAGLLLGLLPPAVFPAGAAAALPAALGLAGGWLVLTAAEPWSAGTLRRSGAGARLPVMLIPALVLGGAAALACRGSDRLAASLVVGCGALFLDPEAARDALRRSSRPSPSARMAPAVTGLALGFGLILSAVATGHSPWRPLTAYLLGILMGLTLGGLLRLAEGKGMILTLLAAAAVLGCGLARRLDLSAPALLLVCGTILADDPARRDLVFSAMREYERSFKVGFLILAGWSLQPALESIRTTSFWIVLVLLCVVRPFLWRFVPLVGLGARQALPLSALVLLPALAAGNAPIAAGVAASWALCEIVSRMAPGPGPETDAGGGAPAPSRP